MSEQISFPGFGDLPQTPMANRTKPAAKAERLPYALKFTLFPTPTDSAEIVRLTGPVLRSRGITGTALKPHRLHVTLHNLGEYAEVPQDLIDTAIRAGDALACGAFEVAFDCAMSFPSGGTYVLSGREGTRQLAAFHEELGESMRRQGLRAARKFTPSMALVYDRHFVAEHSITPVHWTACEFMLIRGHIGKGTFDTLAQWSLK